MIRTPLILKKDEIKMKTPYITIPKHIFNEMLQLIRANDKEIMLLGFVDKTETEGTVRYNIADFVIPPQDSNSSAFVTTNDEEYAKWIITLPREQRKRLKCHIHSHPNMSPTPSGTDIDTINDKIENIDDFYIRIIANQDGEFYIELFDIENRQNYKKLELYILGKNKEEILSTGFDGFKYRSIRGIKTREEDLKAKQFEKPRPKYSGYMGLGQFRQSSFYDGYEDWDKGPHSTHNTVIDLDKQTEDELLLDCIISLQDEELLLLALRAVFHKEELFEELSPEEAITIYQYVSPDSMIETTSKTTTYEMIQQIVFAETAE